MEQASPVLTARIMKKQTLEKQKELALKATAILQSHRTKTRSNSKE
jgi:hypothetical protein